MRLQIAAWNQGQGSVSFLILLAFSLAVHAEALIADTGTVSVIWITFPETCPARVQAGVSSHPFRVFGTGDEGRAITVRCDSHVLISGNNGHVLILRSDDCQTKCDEQEQE